MKYDTMAGESPPLLGQHRRTRLAMGAADTISHVEPKGTGLDDTMHLPEADDVVSCDVEHGVLKGSLPQ